MEFSHEKLCWEHSSNMRTSEHACNFIEFFSGDLFVTLFSIIQNVLSVKSFEYPRYLSIKGSNFLPLGRSRSDGTKSLWLFVISYGKKSPYRGFVKFDTDSLPLNFKLWSLKLIFELKFYQKYPHPLPCYVNSLVKPFHFGVMISFCPQRWELEWSTVMKTWGTKYTVDRTIVFFRFWFWN